MGLVAYVATAILLLLIGAQIFLRSYLVSKIKYFFWIPVGIIFAYLLYESGQTYFGWLTSGPPARFLLPPYEPISYYLFYITTRFWLPYLLSLAFSGIAFLTAKYLNKRFDNRFFYDEEPYIIALGMFLSGHPFWLGFLIITGIVYLLYSLATALSKSREARASFYYFWLWGALSIVLLKPFLPQALINIFKI